MHTKTSLLFSEKGGFLVTLSKKLVHAAQGILTQEQSAARYYRVKPVALSGGTNAISHHTHRCPLSPTYVQQRI